MIHKAELFPDSSVLASGFIFCAPFRLCLESTLTNEFLEMNHFVHKSLYADLSTLCV